MLFQWQFICVNWLEWGNTVALQVTFLLTVLDAEKVSISMSSDLAQDLPYLT